MVHYVYINCLEQYTLKQISQLKLDFILISECNGDLREYFPYGLYLRLIPGFNAGLGTTKKPEKKRRGDVVTYTMLLTANTSLLSRSSESEVFIKNVQNTFSDTLFQSRKVLSNHLILDFKGGYLIGTLLPLHICRINRVWILIYLISVFRPA